MKNNKTVLQNLHIKDTIYKFDKWGCWCDYLRLNFKDSSDFIEDYINLVDVDNSNFCTIDIDWIVFTIQKILCKTWIWLFFCCSFNDVSVPCFEFVKFNWNTAYQFKSYWKLDFYWSMFRLVDIWFFNESIFLTIKDLISSENAKITRFDYRIDFFSCFKEHKIPTRDEFLWYKHSQSLYKPYYQWDVLIDWYVWSKKNWRYAIRYYDKLLDSDNKSKIFLYQDYFNYKCVHRLEFEFQRNFLKWYSFYDFYDWLIQNRIESILWLSNDLFIWNLFYKYDKDYRITEKNKTQYLKRYSTSSVRLAKNWINPLIQCYKALFYELEDDELNKNTCDFLDFIWSDKFKYKLKYDKMKNLFLDLHKI